MRKSELVLENNLRQWLRSVWKKSGIGLQWIEPAKGSSVGFPDVLVPIDGMFAPLELKSCKKDNLILNDTKERYSFHCDVRPSQKRFHLLAQNENIFSGFLVANGTERSFDVWLSSNDFHAWEKHEKPGQILIAANQTKSASINRVDFCDILREMMQNYRSKINV